jgi:GT2 family glycosyltransferase
VLSVLIVNWNTRDLLRACLQSLHTFPPQIDHEIIVVDNESSDGSSAMVRKEFPHVVCIEPGSNTGYAGGNNLAFGAARGTLLLTLNPDTEFRDDSLQKSVDWMKNHPSVGALGIRQIMPDGSIQKSVRGFPTVLGILGAFTKLDRLFPTGSLGSYTLREFDYRKTQPAAQPMGTFLLFRRQALTSIGDAARPFDEEFPIFFNEVDLLKRLDDAGWPCWYLAEAEVLHHHGSSTKQVKKSMIWESHRSLVRYFSKHLRGAARFMLLPLTAAAFLAAFVRARGVHAGFRP